MDDSILDIDEALSDSFCHPSDECFEDIQKIVQQWKQTSSSSSSSSSGSTSTTTSGYEKTGDKYVDTRTFTRPKKRLSQQYLSNISSAGNVAQPQHNSQINIGERKPINLQVGGLVTTSQMQRSYLGDVSPPSSYLMCRSNISNITDTNNTMMGNSLITSGDFSNVSYFMENSCDLSSTSPLNELLSTTFPTHQQTPPLLQQKYHPRKTYDELLEEENLLKEISNYNYELANGSESGGGSGGIDAEYDNKPQQPSGNSSATTDEELNNTIRLNSTYLNDSEIGLNDVTITKSPKMIQNFNTTFDAISKNMNETLIIDTNIESMSNQHQSLDSQATSLIMNETFDCNNQPLQPPPPEQYRQPSPPPPIPPRPQSTFSKKLNNKIMNETYESSMLPPPQPVTVSQLPSSSSSSSSLQNTIKTTDDDLANRTVNIVPLSKQKLPSFGSNRTINYSQIGDTEMCEFFDDDDDVITGENDEYINNNENELKLGSFSSFELQSTPIRPTINHHLNTENIANISPIIIDTGRSNGRVCGGAENVSNMDDIKYPKEFVEIVEKDILSNTLNEEEDDDDEVLELRNGGRGTAASYSTKLNNNQKNHDSREQDERQSLKNFEEFEKSMSFIKSDKDFEEMLNDFGRNEAVEKESTKMKQSLDLIKKRHSLLNLEKQQEDLKKSFHDNIRMAESIEKSMLTTSNASSSSLLMPNGINTNGNGSLTGSSGSGGGGGERLLRRSRLFDDVSPMNKSYTTSTIMTPPIEQQHHQAKTIISSENNLSTEELNNTNDYGGGGGGGGGGVVGSGESKLKHRHHHHNSHHHHNHHPHQNATAVNNVDNQEDLSAAQNPDRFKTIRIIRKPPVETNQLHQVFNTATTTTATTTIGINPLQNTQFTRNSKLSSYDHNVPSYNQQEDDEEELQHENTQDFYGVNNSKMSMGVNSIRSIQPPQQIQHQQLQSQQQHQQLPQQQPRRPRQLSLLAKRDYSSKSSSVDSLSLKPRTMGISNNQLNHQQQQQNQQQYYQPKSVNNFHPIKSPMGNKSKSIHDLADARRVSSTKQQPLTQLRQPQQQQHQQQQPENNIMFRNNKKTEIKDTMFKVPQQPIGGGNYNANAIGGNYQQSQQQQPQQRTLVRRSGLMRPSSGLIRPSSGYYSSNIKPNDETGRFSSSNSLSSSSSKGSIHKIEDDVIETNNKLNITITKPLVSVPPTQATVSSSSSSLSTTIITKPKIQSSIPGGRPSGIPQSSSTAPMRKRSGLPRPMSMASR